MTEEKRCHICGCTEENPCITDEGPCYWAFEDRAGPVCSACVIALPPDPKRGKYPEAHIILEKRCRSCGHLKAGELYRLKDCFTCELGKFGENQFYRWSGIKRPNKTVAEARRNCKEWTIHPSWKSSEA